MRTKLNFNAGWTFHDGDAPELRRAATPGKPVRLPHTAVELPYSYFDERSYQRTFTYQKTIVTDPSWEGKEAAMIFDGAMANSKVYLNGEEIAAHPDGYTPFRVRLTGKLSAGDNLVAVVIDGSENPAIPPFGGRIDYLTYAGIYRDAWLEITAPVHIENVKIETPNVLADMKAVHVAVSIDNPQALELGGQLTAVLCDSSGVEVHSVTVAADQPEITFEMEDLRSIALWDLDTPTLYTLKLTLTTSAGSDNLEAHFGFRSVSFTPDGFLLNGRKIKLRGLNRHQSFPYVGYALPRAAQERDASIIKDELGCNLVRSSHYPASPWFLDQCDRIGLLVLEELPGWQHIGDEAWQAASVKNVEAMIRRDWNHPSIISWGVRINESGDSRAFYAETNRVAHALDSTRATNGVRCLTELDFQEDLYTMNDFFLGNEELGGNRPRTPLRPQQEITGFDHTVPYMVTEYNGHMFPTKTYDQEQRQAEHVRRHLDVMNAVAGDPQIAGATGWCAFDYNTHADFGSGDRICHHGVMDMFREPKFAAYAYASQVDPAKRVVFEPVTRWTLGDRNIGGVIPLMVLTNCEEVELVHANGLTKRLGPDRKNFPHLPHPPVIFERSHFTEAELLNWGQKWQDGRVVGYIDGKQVAEVRLAANPIPTILQVQPDREYLAATGDCVRVIVRALDQVGRKLPYFNDFVTISVKGAARLIGPSVSPLRGGSTGFWIESVDAAGLITVSVSCPQFATQSISLELREV